MPFQDDDEVAAEPTRQPTGVERLLRKIFVEDWSLKLLSLAITLGLWLVVATQNEPVTTHVSVQLNFIRPQSLDISNDPPKTVDVTLEGSRSKLDSLSAPDLVATIDITDQRAGERLLRLSEKAQLTLPHGVRVLNFLPSAIPIRLEPIIEKQLQTEPRVEGKPADGYEVYSITVSDPVLKVRGPASRLNALQKAPTETIWLTGHKASFTATDVAIDIPDPKVELLDPDVDVKFEIGEQRGEKSFSKVPVVSQAGMRIEPRMATISVVGHSRDLEGLKIEDLKIVLNSTLEPRLEVSPAFQGKISLKSISPSEFIQSK